MPRSANLTDTSAAVLTVRVPVELRDRMDAVLANRPIKIPRNTWVLEAVLEKLVRDEMKGEGYGSR